MPIEPPPTCSVLLPTWRRPERLRKCLAGIAAQTVRPLEVIVVWQGDDEASRNSAELASIELDLPIRLVHSSSVGIVPAENVALAESHGQVVALIDDDAVSGPRWLERHLSHYADPTIGAVGGPFDNYHPDGRPFPRRRVRPVGRLRWYGKAVGNIFDHDEAWRVDSARATEEVHHLAGGNMTFRRAAIGRFNENLRPYWQSFELEACLQVARNGYRVLFDYQNIVDHYPSSGIFDGQVEKDLERKVQNPTYNMAYVLSLHSPAHLRAVRLLYLLLVGSRSTPGICALLLNLWHDRGRRPLSWRIWKLTTSAVCEGWKHGARARSTRGRIQDVASETRPT